MVKLIDTASLSLAAERRTGLSPVGGMKKRAIVLPCGECKFLIHARTVLNQRLFANAKGHDVANKGSCVCQRPSEDYE